MRCGDYAVIAPVRSYSTLVAESREERDTIRTAAPSVCVCALAPIVAEGCADTVLQSRAGPRIAVPSAPIPPCPARREGRVDGRAEEGGKGGRRHSDSAVETHCHGMRCVIHTADTLRHWGASHRTPLVVPSAALLIGRHSLTSLSADRWADRSPLSHSRECRRQQQGRPLN